MAREQLANALDVIGSGIGVIAGTRMEREAAEIENQRKTALIELERTYRREDETIRQTAEMSRYAATQASEDARQKEAFAHNERLASERAGHEERLASERYSRDDIEALRASNVQTTRRIDDRIRDLRDDLRSPDFAEGMPGRDDILRELDDLEFQGAQVEASFLRSMADAGVPGFKEQIDALLAGNKGREQPPPGSGSDADRETERARLEADPNLQQLRSRLGGAPTTPEQPGAAPPASGPVSALVPGASPPGGAPQQPPPPPLPPMPSYSSEGRKPLRRQTTGRGGVQVTDVSDMFTMREDVRPQRSAPGRGAQEVIPKTEARPQSPSMDDRRALSILTAIRAGKSVTAPDEVKSMAPAKLRELGFTDEEILEVLGRNRTGGGF